MNSWQEVRTSQDVAEALGLTGAGAAPLELLVLAPGSERYLVAKDAAESHRPGGYGLMLSRTRFFFNVSACRQFRGDAMVALATFLATHSAPASAAATTLRKVYDNLKRLTEDEAKLVHTIIRVCPGNPYEAAVSEDEVRRGYPGPSESVDDLLDAIERKGVIRARRGGRIELVF